MTGAVTLSQRFGSSVNLNVHFHLLVLDGVYRREGEGRLQFVPSPAPNSAELQGLVQRIAARISRVRIGLDVDRLTVGFVDRYWAL